MPVLHSRHPHGTLELELGDWMDNRRYRNPPMHCGLFMHVCVMTPFLIPANVEPFNSICSSKTKLDVECFSCLRAAGRHHKKKTWDYLDGGLCSQKDV